MIGMRSQDPPRNILLPCTCEIWSDKIHQLPKIRDAVNGMCNDKHLGIVCKNVSASVMHQLDDDLVGSWALEMCAISGRPLTASDENLHHFLRIVQGQLEGVAPDFVQVRVIRNHSHKDFL